MACFDPHFASVSADGEVTLKPSPSQAQALDGQYMEIPCGNCQSCRAAHARDWAIRAQHESQMHRRKEGRGSVINGCFVTLTYRPEDLPKDGSLDHKDFQNFCKKLRRDVGRFRFLHCGEYGERNGRPHHHACLFGIDFHWDRYEWHGVPGDHIWRSPTLEEAWKKGFCTIAPLNYATAKYTAGYVLKKASRNNKAKLGITAKEEYITMSRDPGLGATWFKRYWRSVYPRDEVVVAGQTYRPPKYYDKLLKKMDPELFQEVMSNRELYTASQPPTTPRVLEARRENWVGNPKNKNQRDKV